MNSIPVTQALSEAYREQKNTPGCGFMGKSVGFLAAVAALIGTTGLIFFYATSGENHETSPPAFSAEPVFLPSPIPVESTSLAATGETLSCLAIAAVNVSMFVGALGVGQHVRHIEQPLLKEADILSDYSLQPAETVDLEDERLEELPTKENLNPSLKVNYTPETFYAAYQEEIESIYKKILKTGVHYTFSFSGNNPIGDWIFLGGGGSKIVMVHPNLEGYVFKFNRGNSKVDLYDHYTNLQKAKDFIEMAGLKHILIPESHLIRTNLAPLIIEEAIEFSETMPEDTEVSREELKKFIKYSYLCDIEIRDGDIINDAHNAGFVSKVRGVNLPSSAPAKIGIIDFDCKK